MRYTLLVVVETKLILSLTIQILICFAFMFINGDVKDKQLNGAKYSVWPKCKMLQIKKV